MSFPQHYTVRSEAKRKDYENLLANTIHHTMNRIVYEIHTWRTVAGYFLPVPLRISCQISSKTFASFRHTANDLALNDNRFLRNLMWVCKFND